MWQIYHKHFLEYLILERSVSEHTLDAYKRDVDKFIAYIRKVPGIETPKDIQPSHIDDFLIYIHKLEVATSTQARILSGIKAFFHYLVVEDILIEDPTELSQGPRQGRTIPDVLHIEEINAILDNLDMSLPHATRNKAIIETLYACGLRVSELISLRMSHIYWEEEFIRVIGKNNKERLVPISNTALHAIKLYIETDRKKAPLVKGQEDMVFLNRRGKGLTRNMIFLIVKSAATEAGIDKKVSPHTFRHSFATHLVEGGADLRSVQQMLGHESITTTEIYTHLDRSFLRETILKYHPFALGMKNTKLMK